MIVPQNAVCVVGPHAAVRVSESTGLYVIAHHVHERVLACTKHMCCFVCSKKFQNTVGFWCAERVIL